MLRRLPNAPHLQPWDRHDRFLGVCCQTLRISVWGLFLVQSFEEVRVMQGPPASSEAISVEGTAGRYVMQVHASPLRGEVCNGTEDAHLALSGAHFACDREGCRRCGHCGPEPEPDSGAAGQGLAWLTPVRTIL